MENLLKIVRRMERRWNVEQDSDVPARIICDQWHRRESLVYRWDYRPRGALCRRWWEKNDPEEPADHALGRSRGGFSTKIHLLCDGNGLPLHFHLTAGQDHESTVLETLLEGADQQVVNCDGESIAWPVALAGDKRYRADWIDAHLLNLGITPVIPSKENEVRSARPIEFDRDAYRQRNIIERLIAWCHLCYHQS